MIYTAGMKTLKEVRKQYNITQQQLANIINVKQCNIARWESGRIELGSLKFEGIKAILEQEFQNITINGLDGFYNKERGKI